MMFVSREEIFGPVLCVLNAGTLDEATALLNANTFGNGAAIFTQSGPIARKFEVEAGRCVVEFMSLLWLLWCGEISDDLPSAFFFATGSFLEDINFYGKGGMNFYTQNKGSSSSIIIFFFSLDVALHTTLQTTTVNWRHFPGEEDVSVNVPVLK
ncbi:Methylmalonate-semialdehyde dehydrogenase [Mycena sanguinolenta]|uniref:Methylmalonate-semialdehyde dehydrogenase n=1 Tax=Mycena sanguinolenta TaxID=230812 RepID=A0A8H6YWK6_9AGAR|nr:Methylmalonate-semialdehyde dehydrogenase [Mycena sanguinolenta]